MQTFSFVSWLIPRRSHFLRKSSKCRGGFVKSVILFQVNVAFSREGASYVGEIIGRFKWLVIQKDVWLVIHLPRCRLVHVFCLFFADGKTTFFTVSREVIHALHFPFGVAVESAVIRKEEFSQCDYIDLFLP